MKVHIWPTLHQLASNHGIGRVIHAQYRDLPKLGIEMAGPEQADVIACHTQQAELPRVDVLHAHGAYWTGDIGSGNYNPSHVRANQEIVKAARRALTITVPSEWVGMCFKRDMRIAPTVIGHGLDLEEWTPGSNEGYILWNKNRGGDVCDPTPAVELAKRKLMVISTFGPSEKECPPSLTVTGALPHQGMKQLIRGADLYLATTRETFGIGTLEAMACGVPVVGFDWGGTKDLVRHDLEGLLVKPGDYEALYQATIEIRAHYKRFSRAARERAREFSWDKVMRQYAELYQRVWMKVASETAEVSIVITNHNYGNYVGQAIESALAQTYPCEVVVVDDGSDDDSKNILLSFAERAKIIYQDNQGVAAARNRGIAEATGDFIICLDADDYLDPRYAALGREVMSKDRGLGIVWGGLSVLHPTGARTGNVWTGGFDWEGQATARIPPSTTIPTGAMFRKRLWERSGGYRQEYAPGEDAEFYTRGLSLGFTAQKLTEEPLIFYREHGAGAHRTKPYLRIDDDKPWMRDRQYPMAAPAKVMPKVRSYNTPVVSVIVPIGPGHETIVKRAIDSVIGQTLREWELITVWDVPGTSNEWWKLYPFLKLVYSGRANPSAARNAGLENVASPLVLFLDADDTLEPDALAKMVELYSHSEGRYVYSDWNAVENKVKTPQAVPNWKAESLLTFPQHAITILMGTEQARSILFDEVLEAHEDWDFFIRCALVGIQGVRLPEALLNVNVDEGTRTRRVLRQPDSGLTIIRNCYVEKGKTMASCCGGNSANPVLAAKAALGLLENPSPAAPAQAAPQMNTEPMVIRMEFTGLQKGSMSFGGSGATPSGQVYRGGANVFDRYVDADPRDVEWMKRTGAWRVVPPPPVSIPVAPPIVESQIQEETQESIPVVFEQKVELIVEKRKPGRPKKIQDALPA